MTSVHPPAPRLVGIEPNPGPRHCTGSDPALYRRRQFWPRVETPGRLYFGSRATCAARRRSSWRNGAGRRSNRRAAGYVERRAASSALLDASSWCRIWIFLVSSLGAMRESPPATSPEKCRPGDPLPSAARCERARSQGESATLEGPTGGTRRGAASGVCEQGVLCAPAGLTKRTGCGSDLLRERRGLNRLSPRFLLLSAWKARQSTSRAPGGVSASSSRLDPLGSGSHPSEGRTANSTPDDAGEGTRQQSSEEEDSAR